jgi:hypothetical protein
METRHSELENNDLSTSWRTLKYQI